MKKPAIWQRILTPLTQPRTPKRAQEIAFAPDFLAQLERLRIAALRAVGGGLREGHRLGAYKGGQLEFHGHRDYSPGDELRYLDWNSFARLDRPYIKEFAREESGVLHIIVDATPSMNLGSPTKRVFAQRVAALFAHVALSSKDSVELFVFQQTGEALRFPGRNAKTTTSACISFFSAVESSVLADDRQPSDAAGETGVLKVAISNFLKRAPRRGGVILISDFWQEENEIVESVSRLSQAGFDVSALHILAAEEIAPTTRGELRVNSIESPQEAAVWFSAAMAARYGEELEKHRATVQSIFRRRGGNYLFASSDTSIEKVLIAALRQRRWLL